MLRAATRMPALDEFLNATAQQQVDLFESRSVKSLEGGVKGVMGPLGFTVNGFYTKLTNIVSQGLVIDSVTGGSVWTIIPSPENRSYGAEVELVASPIQGLQLLGNGTFLRAELGAGAGADIGSLINGVPKVIGNLSATYLFSRFRLTGDWHYVGSRFANVTVGTTLPAYGYWNFGGTYMFPNSNISLDANLLNAFQGQGLEEGNPRLLSNGGTGIFLARPILPRRLIVAMRYNFGNQGATQARQ